MGQALCLAARAAQEVQLVLERLRDAQKSPRSQCFTHEVPALCSCKNDAKDETAERTRRRYGLPHRWCSGRLRRL